VIDHTPLTPRGDLLLLSSENEQRAFKPARTSGDIYFSAIGGDLFSTVPTDSQKCIIQVPTKFPTIQKQSSFIKEQFEAKLIKKKNFI
jgi:hypothetical protein